MTEKKCLRSDQLIPTIISNKLRCRISLTEVAIHAKKSEDE